MAYRKTLKLLIGYYLKGHETDKHKVRTYQFNIQNVTLRIHQSPPSQPMFFLSKSRLPQSANETKMPMLPTPQIVTQKHVLLFEFLYEMVKDRGSFEAMRSPTWQVIAIANSVVYDLNAKGDLSLLTKE